MGKLEFKTTTGSDYKFPLMHLAAVDVDGDNVRVREFIDMNGQSSADVHTAIPSLLVVSNMNDDGDDENSKNLHEVGPIPNRTGINTISVNVKMNYHFISQSKINVTIGSQIDDTGTTGLLQLIVTAVYILKVQ